MRPCFFIYGEFVFLAGAILAGAGYLNIWIVSLACILGGIIGDSSSYFIGRYYGARFFKRFFKEENTYFNDKNYMKARKFFDRHGAKSVFFARFMGPLSWVTPFLAGTAGLHYKKFLIYNLPGVTLGISQFLIVGYFFDFSYTSFLPLLKKYILWAILTLILSGAGILFIRKMFKPQNSLRL